MVEVDENRDISDYGSGYKEMIMTLDSNDYYHNGYNDDHNSDYIKN